MKIQIPGSFRTGVAYLDLETAKVPTPEGYRMPSGESLRRRWAVIAAAVARDGAVTLVDGSEAACLTALGSALKGAEVHYQATRQFDEMVCRGRFTNARRAHLPEPVWPAVPGAERMTWVNLGVLPAAERGADCASRDVPMLWAKGEREVVRVHLLRDVVELVLADGEPDAVCRRWCQRVMLDYDFAAAML